MERRCASFKWVVRDLGPCRNYVGEMGVIDPTSATLSISTRSSA